VPPAEEVKKVEKRLVVEKKLLSQEAKTNRTVKDQQLIFGPRVTNRQKAPNGKTKGKPK